MYLLPCLWALGPVAQGWIQRMCPAEQTDVGPEQRPCPDGDLTGVDDNAVEVDKNALSHLYIKPIVNSKRSFDPGFMLKQCFIFGWVLTRGRQRGLIINDTVGYYRVSLIWLQENFNEMCSESTVYVMATHSFQSSTKRRRDTSPALLNRLQACLQRVRIAMSSGVKA